MLFPMRTTLDLPDGLIDEARHALGLTSKTETVVYALREAVRRKRLEELKGMFGKVNIDIDIGRSRRRSVEARS
jgi:Arc/MetJ family transcription regulator